MASYRILGPVAVIEVNNPPVNALSYAVRSGLFDGIKKANQDVKVKAIVIVGKGRTFPSGADIREFGQPPKGPNLKVVGEYIEASKKPVVCGIHGTALGGGLEVALFSHYRIAHKTARVGFTEVLLGILPGAGGTQRLPRVAGIPVSLEMITSGRHVPAPEALKYGILDKVVEKDITEESVKFANSIADQPFESRKLKNSPVKNAENLDADCEAAMKRVKTKTKGFFAPISCIKAVRASVELPYEEGLKLEGETFIELMMSGQSRALRYAFFAERIANKWQLPSGENATTCKPQDVKSSGVIGAGTMGSGIAISLLTAGIPVILVEQNKKFLDSGVQTIKSFLEGNVRLKRLSPQGLQQCLSLLKPTENFEDLKNVDLVIEAVYENLALKREIFGKLDKICKPDTILCTNTSTLDIDQIAIATNRPDKVVGTHFFAPAAIMRLLENIYGKDTSGTTVATVMALGKKIRKIPVLVKTCFGFVANRMNGPFNSEASFLIEGGTLPHEVDSFWEDFGMIMGPFKVRDLSGIDVGWRIRREIAKASGQTITKDTRYLRGDRYTGLLSDRLYEMGRYGRKTGSGWYRYEKPGGKVAMVDDEVTDMILSESKRLGIEREKTPPQEILERCLYSAINEGFKCLEDGVAAKPEDIDVIWLMGFSWPRYTGGPMYYASQVGLKEVYDRICHYHRLYPDRSYWLPSDLLRRLSSSESQPPMSDWNLEAASKL